MNQVIKRALLVLDILSRQRETVGVRQMAALARISPATSMRVLTTLTKCGFVKRSNDGRYSMTTKILQLAENLVEQMELPRIAGPVLRDIRDRCNETVSLWVMEGTQRICIASEQSTQGVRRVLPVGASFPLWVGASGKALLAFLPENVREELLVHLPLQRFTDKTITELKTLKRQLQQVLAQGYAISSEERVIGAVAVSAPVRESKGTAVAAFTISAPRERHPNLRKSILPELACEGAVRVSKELGYQAPASKASALLASEARSGR